VPEVAPSPSSICEDRVAFTAICHLWTRRFITRVELGIHARSMGKLTVEGLPVPEAAAQKLRPGRDVDVVGNRLGQQSP
jgi:hypothetical protein